MTEIRFYDDINSKKLWDDIAEACGCEKFDPEKPWKYLIGKFEICDEPPNNQWYRGRTISCEGRRIGDLSYFFMDDELAFLGQRIIDALNYFEGVVKIPKRKT